MAGYNYRRGMSNNAVFAYKCGKKPLSKITAADLKEYEIPCTLKVFKELASDGIISPCEWHHSGGTWYNKVDFYDLEAIAEEIREHPDLLNPKIKSQKATSPVQRVTGQFPVWGGSKRHPKIVGYEEFSGELRGDWIYLDNGGKKKASGNHITWRNIS